MKKYAIYRTLGNADRDIKKHELIGIEFGEDIYDATGAIMQTVTDDLSGNPEYENCRVYAYDPEEAPSYFRTKRYQYVMDGIVSPRVAEKNIVIPYAIIETDAPGF